MGGGGGGYERPDGDSGSNGDDDEREPRTVPEPDPDEGTSEETEEGDDESGGGPDSPPAGGGGGGGAPAGVPPGGSSGNGGRSGSEDETEPSEEDDHQEEGEDGEEPREDPEDHTDEDQIELDQGDDSEDESADDEDEQQEEEDHDEDDEEEECLIAESTILHSPNPDPLDDAVEGDICTIQLRDQAVCVVDTEGRVIGSIAEPWVGALKECIEEGHQYRAHILEIDGGSCEVYVTNKCLLDQDIVLTSSTAAEESQIHPGTYLALEKTSGDVLAVTLDETEVGEIPSPWAELLSDCIDQGREYRARVIDIGSEQCGINIQNGPVDE